MRGQQNIKKKTRGKLICLQESDERRLCDMALTG